MHALLTGLSLSVIALAVSRGGSTFGQRSLAARHFSLNHRRFMSSSTGSYLRSSYYANQNMLVLNQLAALSAADNFMVVLCGIPGSGKSTYARRLVGGLPPDYRKMWVVANQDKLGSRQKVLSVAQSALRAKHNVVIDRCNFNPEQRSHWVELAQEQNISALIAVTMPEHVNLQLCVNRATIRGNSDGHGEDVNWNAVCRGMRNEYVMPTMAEGFSGVFQCSNEADLVCFANSIADIGNDISGISRSARCIHRIILALNKGDKLLQPPSERAISRIAVATRAAGHNRSSQDMDCAADSKGEPNRYLVIANVSKKNNVKFLINAAAAYKFQVILVGCKKMEDLHVSPELTFLYMDTLDQAVAFLAEKSIPLVGIEIMDGAKSVVDNPFSQSIAFMPGNEGTGMSNHQKEVCSSFVYIPQYGAGTASLNVYVATTLIIHRFTLWANSTPC